MKVRSPQFRFPPFPLHDWNLSWKCFDFLCLEMKISIFLLACWNLDPTNLSPIFNQFYRYESTNNRNPAAFEQTNLEKPGTVSKLLSSLKQVAYESVVKKPVNLNKNHQIAIKLSSLVGNQFEKLANSLPNTQDSARQKCALVLREPEGRLFAKSKYESASKVELQIAEKTVELQKELNKVYESSCGLTDPQELSNHLGELKIIGEVIAFYITDDFDLTYQTGFQHIIASYKRKIKEYLLGSV